MEISDIIVLGTYFSISNVYVDEVCDDSQVCEIIFILIYIIARIFIQVWQWDNRRSMVAAEKGGNNQNETTFKETEYFNSKMNLIIILNVACLTSLKNYSFERTSYDNVTINTCPINLNDLKKYIFERKLTENSK